MKKIMMLFVSVVSIMMTGGWLNSSHAFEAGDIEIHGFISQGYLFTDKNNYLAETEDGTFEFNEMGINFSADLTELLHVGVQFFARDLGTVGNDDVVLDWAYGDFRWKDWLGFRAGRIKIDYGLYNETREMDMLRTGVMLPQSVYSELWRDSFSGVSGAALYGYIPLSVMGRFAYNLEIGAMTFKEDEGFSRTFAPRLHETLDISGMDADFAWFANAQWHTPLPGMKTKFTYYEIENLKADGDISVITKEGDIINSLVTYEFSEKSGYVLSLEYIWKNLTFTAEYAKDDYQIERDMEAFLLAQVATQPQADITQSAADAIQPAAEITQAQEQTSGEGLLGTGQPKKKTSEGWYVSASYRFTDRFETGLTYSEYYPDADNKHGEEKREGDKFTSWLKTTTLSARFDINDYWLLKLEASYNDGFGGINLADNPEGLERCWYLFAAKMTFNF